MKHEAKARKFVCLALAALALSGLSCAKPARESFIPPGYAAWKKTTEVVLDYPIPGHEDRFRVIYINELGSGVSRRTSGTGRVEFPAGTVIAKEIFSVSKPGSTDKPVMLTAMVKAPDDPQASAGWLWLVKDLASGVESVYTGDFCVRCHANANEKHPYGYKNPEGLFSDYVFFVPGD